MKKILLSITLAFILVVSTFAINCDAGVSACMDSNPFSYENDLEGALGWDSMCIDAGFACMEQM